MKLLASLLYNGIFFNKWSLYIVNVKVLYIMVYIPLTNVNLPSGIIHMLNLYKAMIKKK